MAKAYHIVQWTNLYETAETRKIRTLTYYAKPNKLVGEGIGFTLSQPNAPHLLGMWALLEALASTAPQEFRGWLVRNGTALDAARMANLTRIDRKHFEEALSFFSRTEIRWLENAECPGLTAQLPGIPPEHPQTTGKPLAGSPGIPPEHPQTTGKPLAGSPGIPPEHPQTTGTISLRGKREGRGKKERERETHAQDVVLPDEQEVRAWAQISGVDENYAVERFHATTEKHGWVSNGRLIEWRKRFKRFWESDREEWFSRKKTAAPAGSAADRPNGWKQGDEAWWWTGPIADVEATLSGALLGDKKKTAARLREVLESRKAK